MGFCKDCIYFQTEIRRYLEEVCTLRGISVGEYSSCEYFEER